MRVVCRGCAAAIDAPARVGRRDTCPRCGADLHCCRQCRFHDPRAYNECREPQAERVVDKERANFCDYFAAAESGAPASPVATPGARRAPARPAGDDDARVALDRLFRRR
jgi:hypothetical protein